MLNYAESASFGRHVTLVFATCQIVLLNKTQFNEAQTKAQNRQNPACLEPCGFQLYAPRQVCVSK